MRKLSFIFLILLQLGAYATADICTVNDTSTLTIKWGILYVPAVNTITVNTAVTWINPDSSRTHNIAATSSYTLYNTIPVLAPGATFCYVFTQPGVFQYASTDIGFMVGTLTINPLPVSSTTTTTGTTNTATTTGAYSSVTRTVSSTTSLPSTSLPSTSSAASTSSFISTTSTQSSANTYTTVSSSSQTSQHATTASTQSLAPVTGSTSTSTTQFQSTTSVSAPTITATITTPTSTPTPTVSPVSARPVQDTAVLYMKGLDYQSVVSNNDDFSFCFRAALVSSIAVPLSSVVITSISEGSVIVGFSVLDSTGGNNVTLYALEDIVNSASDLSARFLTKLTTLLSPSYFEQGNQALVQIVTSKSEAFQFVVPPPTPEPVTTVTAVSITLVSFLTVIFYVFIASFVVSSVFKMTKPQRISSKTK